jgi:hypothetical protein
MTDQTTEQTPEQTDDTGQGSSIFEKPAKTLEDRIERILDLDAVMSSARRVERVVRICLRPDLEAEYYDLQDEIADLVDVDGKPLNDSDTETAIGEQSRIVEISERMRALRAEMRDASSTVRFRGMSESEWAGFEKNNRTKDGAQKDDYINRLIVETAIAPTMTIDQFRALRDKLGTAQITAMVNAAYDACTQGGLDVPKLPSFLPSPKPQES